jgi:hypothetical protein
MEREREKENKEKEENRRNDIFQNSLENFFPASD